MDDGRNGTVKQIICIKWGQKFGPEFVNRLHGMISRNITPPFRLYCFTDDGAGLNRERILAKAMSQGMSVSESMTDEEVGMLIFAPGFSTAEQVTDVSGRGVGMDAVRGFLQREGGDVHIHFLDTNVGADFRAFDLVVSLPARFGTQLDLPSETAEPDARLAPLAV